MAYQRKVVPIVVLMAAAIGAIGYVVARSAMGPDDPAGLLASGDPDRQRQATAALAGGLGTPEGLARVERAARHKDTQVARGALRSLVAARRKDEPLPPKVLDILERAIDDPRPAVQDTAIQVLVATTPPAPEDTRAPEMLLKKFRTSPSAATRAAAADGLGKMLYWPAMEDLIVALDDESVEVRGAAGVAVRSILGLDMGYRADDPPAKRGPIAEKIRQQWKRQEPFHQDYIRRIRERRKGAKP